MAPDDAQAPAGTLSRSLTYARYLKLDDLFTLQDRLTQAHDELQFIVVHQVFELWFRLLLFELEAIRDAMDRADVPRALHLLRRTHEVIKSILTGFPVLETMRPHDFLEFRAELKPASGFQSLQFREIEFVSGAKDERYLRVFHEDEAGAARLRQRFDEPTLWDAFLELLRRQGLPAATDAQIVHTLIGIHRDPRFADLDLLAESLLEYDLLFAQWRARHVLMVERMIGARPGTGQRTVAEVLGEGYSTMGQGGVEYLKSTLAKRFFPLIWEARTFVER